MLCVVHAFIQNTAPILELNSCFWISPAEENQSAQHLYKSPGLWFSCLFGGGWTFSKGRWGRGNKRNERKSCKEGRCSEFRLEDRAKNCTKHICYRKRIDYIKQLVSPRRARHLLQCVHPESHLTGFCARSNPWLSIPYVLIGTWVVGHPHWKGAWCSL